MVLADPLWRLWIVSDGHLVAPFARLRCRPARAGTVARRAG
jgi:hypothetical protein